ncbi:MAG: PEGA domain-containing protein [Nitrospirae bacterium]|nr:PEGA domain-containing protein [Nitrospirota bacterium]
MRTLAKVLALTALSLALTAVLCAPAEAGRRGHGHSHGHVSFGTSIYFGPGYFGPGYYNPWYDPWYDPWTGPYYYRPYYYPPADYGYLDTDVTPDTAEVWVDGKFFGTASEFDGWFESLKLPLGVHTAEFRLPGYLPYAVSFTITPEDTTSIEHVMQPAPEGYVEPAPPAAGTPGGTTGDAYNQSGQTAGAGTLTITVSPGGAEIFVDGEYKATSPDQAVANELSLPAGRHDVKVSKPGYRDYFAETYVTVGGMVNMSVELKAAE